MQTSPSQQYGTLHPTTADRYTGIELIDSLLCNKVGLKNLLLWMPLLAVPLPYLFLFRKWKQGKYYTSV